MSLSPLDLESLLIDEKDLKLLDIIGKGQFGNVYKAYWKEMQVAVKETDKSFQAEVDVLRQAKFFCVNKSR